MANHNKQYVIIGNGACGSNCAENIRKNDPECEIYLIDDEPYPLYNRVALPPFIKHKVSTQKVFLRTIDYYKERRINLLLETTVVRMDCDENLVWTADGKEFHYDALLIATGGRPIRLGVPGDDAQGLFHFQYYDEAVGIIERSKVARTAVVIGGSFIAYELAEGFRANGLEVTWLIRSTHWLSRILDQDGGAVVDDIARSHGVNMVYGEQAAEIACNNGDVSEVVTASGKRFACDMVGVGIGLKPNADFAAGTPIEVRKGLVTNEYLETRAPGVYAGGDVAEFYDLTISFPNQVGTWGNATGHGRVIAQTILGDRKPHNDVPFYSSGLFDSVIRVIGLTPENYAYLESYARLDVRNRSYQRLFFHNDRVVGAVLIGELKFRTKIFGLIKSRQVIPENERAKILED